MPNEVHYSAERGLVIRYVRPTPAQTPDSLAGIVEDEETRQLRFYAALAHFATDACLNQPGSLEQPQERIDTALTAHFRPRQGMLTQEDASAHVWLAGTMGATNFLLANYASVVIEDDVRHHKTPPHFAPPGYYFVDSTEAEAPPMVVLYDKGTPEDMHMRAVVKALVDAALHIRESSILGSTYSRYLPVFRMERELRESLPSEVIKGSSQQNIDGLSFNALDAERVRRAASQFVRNVMHGIILLTDGQPRKDIGTLRSLVRENVTALEIAALYPRDTQRVHMGIPGEPYDSIRRVKNIIPQVVKVGDNLRFKGLEEPPHVESMCSGAGSHYVPSQLGSPMFGNSHPISAISKYVDLALSFAPFTLFRDIRQNAQ